MNGFGTLRIARPRGGYRDAIRAYEIEVDGRRVGSLRRGGSLRVELAVGRHEVRARIDWSGSHRLAVDLTSGGVVEVRVSPKRVVDGFVGMVTRTGWINISVEAPRPLLNTTDFLALLIDRVTEAESVVADSLEDNEGEVLLHLIVADIGRLAEDAWTSGRHELLARCLHVFERGLVDGDAAVVNAVAVSFVEDSQLWDPAKKAYSASWPPALTEEARQQREWRPVS